MTHEKKIITECKLKTNAPFWRFSEWFMRLPLDNCAVHQLSVNVTCPDHLNSCLLYSVLTSYTPDLPGCTTPDMLPQRHS